MIVTRQLVFINFPKTGSSYVRRMLRETFNLQRNRRSTLNRVTTSAIKRLPRTGPLGSLRAAFEYADLETAPYRVLDYFNPVRGYFDQHGKVHQAPKQLLGRRFISVARDPLSRFCSYYHYFKSIGADDHLPLLRDAIRSAQDASTISPEAFYEHLFWKHNCFWMHAAGLHGVIGPQTLDFVNHFAIDPPAVFDHLSEGATFDEVRHLFPSDFVMLRYECLATSLQNELRRAGLATLPSEHPLWRERVLPDGIGGNFTREHARQILTPALVERIEMDEIFIWEAYRKLRDYPSGEIRHWKAA
jgi:hypothetical protein